MPLIKFKRGTRAQVNAAEAADGLNQGEPYLITDEGVMALATAVGAYFDLEIAKRYRDFWVDAAAMMPTETNGAEPESTELATNDVNFDGYLFDGVAIEHVQFKTTLPDAWDLGTLKVKYHWKATGSASAGDDIVLGVKARAVGNDEALDGAWGTGADVQDAVLSVDDNHIVTSPAVTVGNTPAKGKLILFDIYRDPTDPNDNMPEDMKLLGVSIQYGESNAAVTAW